MLPQRFTDLTYYDIIEDVSKTFNEDVIRAQLSKGVCDRDKEVKVNGIRFSRAGEHLVIKKSNLEELGIKGGVASNIEEVLSQEKVSAEVIHLKSPRIVIEEKLTPLPVKEGGSFNVGSASISDDDLGAFGETRVESYAGKIVVIPIGMESLVRKTKFEFIQRIIKKAEEDKASAIIFDLNTPGGIAW